MTAKVQAAVALDLKRTEVREFDWPIIPTDGGLLKVEMTGVCGSDWPYFLNYPKSKGALILGHETVGFVDAIGATAAARWGVKEGDCVCDPACTQRRKGAVVRKKGPTRSGLRQRSAVPQESHAEGDARTQLSSGGNGAVHHRVRPVSA